MMMSFGNMGQALNNMGHLFSWSPMCRLGGSFEDKIRTEMCVQISEVADNSEDGERQS